MRGSEIARGLSEIMKNYKHIPDETLMRFLQRSKDESAFNELYERYSQRLLYFMFKMLGQDEAKAQDFLQDVFLKIITAPEKFDPSKNFKTWIFTVAANLCKNTYRQSKPIQIELHESIVSDQYKSDDLLDQQFFHSALADRLNELLPVYKEAFILRYHEGLSLKEIGEVVGAPLGTVKSRLHSALRILSHELEHFKQN